MPGAGRRDWPPAALLLLPLVVVNALVFVVPVLRLAEISLRRSLPSGAIVDGYTLGNYAGFFSDSLYLGLIPTSIGLSAAVTLATLLLSYPLALFLHRSESRWRNLLFVVTVSPLLVSAVVRTYGWMVLLSDRGLVNAVLLGTGLVERPLRLLNNYLGVGIGLVEILMPYMCLALIAGFGRLDRSCEEAAASLGASRRVRFVRVVVPLTMPGILLGCLLCFVLALSSFVTPKLLGGGRVFLLATEVFDQTMVQMKWPLAATISCIVLAIFGVALAGYSALARRLEAR